MSSATGRARLLRPRRPRRPDADSIDRGPGSARSAPERRCQRIPNDSDLRPGWTFDHQHRFRRRRPTVDADLRREDATSRSPCRTSTVATTTSWDRTCASERIEPGVTLRAPHNGPPGAFDPTGEDLACLRDVGGRHHLVGRRRARSGLANPIPPDQQTPAAAPETLPPGTIASTLAEESTRAVLHGKGGWRDHTDGNRITTTRGDKVEVIRGNYKMVMLGRQEARCTHPDGGLLDDATGVDESGGLVDNADLDRPTAPHTGCSTSRTRGQKDSDGRWGWTQVTRTGAFEHLDHPDDAGQRQADRVHLGRRDPELRRRSRSGPSTTVQPASSRTSTRPSRRSP